MSEPKYLTDPAVPAQDYCGRIVAYCDTDTNTWFFSPQNAPWMSGAASMGPGVVSVQFSAEVMRALLARLPR